MELLRINYESEQPTVSARELHEGLEIKTAFKDWFPRMAAYGFEENQDFILVAQKRATNNPKNPTTTCNDYQISIDMAKLICQNGHEIGQNRLFEWMRQNDYLIKSGGSKNMPTQKAMEQKLFEVKERTVVNPDGSVRITRTTLVTGKGQIHFINKFAKMKAEMMAEVT